MITHKGQASWNGDIKSGKGTMGPGEHESNVTEFSVGSRFKDSKGTNPEEMIGAAHAGCFTMALTDLLSKEGYTPKEIVTKADVNLEKSENGFKISSIKLNTEGSIPEIDEKKFMNLSEEAKKTCTVSKALEGVKIDIESKLRR